MCTWIQKHIVQRELVFIRFDSRKASKWSPFAHYRCSHLESIDIRRAAEGYPELEETPGNIYRGLCRTEQSVIRTGQVPTLNHYRGLHVPILEDLYIDGSSGRFSEHADSPDNFDILGRSEMKPTCFYPGFYVLSEVSALPGCE